MAPGLRSSVYPVIALALAAVACGPEAPAIEGGVVHLAPAPAAVEASLAAGRTARVIVLLDEAPVEAAARAAEASPAGAALLDEPQQAAAAALEEVKVGLLAGGTPAELEVVHRYQRLPAVHLELRSPEALRRLRERPEVTRIVEDEPHEALLAESLPFVGQPAAIAAGAAGQGTAVAVLDTGVDYGRAAFGGCTAPGLPAGCRVDYARDFAPDDHALDAHGHGTNVAAIVAAVAPGARILALDVFNGRYAYTSDILEAVDWCIRNRARYGIVALNLSLGSGGSSTPCAGSAFAGSIRAARAAGILSTVAAGNDGKTDRLSAPACVPEAVSVGAVYDRAYGGISYSTCTDFAAAAGQPTCFSNSASFLTVLAPGALVTAGGITMAGTSQAAPHVAGAVAVWKGVLPAATPGELVARLRAGPVVTDPRNGVRTPRLDLTAAAAAACAADLSVPAQAAAVGGQGGTLVVTLSTGPGCAWSLAAPPEWLALSAASGTGPATIAVTAAPNAGRARSAVLTAGRAAVTVTQDPDRIAPTASLALADGARYTRSLAVTLAVGGADPGGLSGMCLSSTAACTGWRPFAAVVPWTLAAGSSGRRTVYLRVKDGAGNVSAPAVASIVYDVRAPAGGRLAAVAGGGAVSLSWPGFADADSGVSQYTLVGSSAGVPATCGVGTRLHAGPATAFVHTGLPAGTRYSYRLCATDGAGNTSAGATATVVVR